MMITMMAVVMIVIMVNTDDDEYVVRNQFELTDRLLLGSDQHFQL